MTKAPKAEVYQKTDWLQFHLSFLEGAENLLKLIVNNDSPDTPCRRNLIPATRLFKHAMEVGIKYLLTKLGVDFSIKANKIHNINDLLGMLDGLVLIEIKEDDQYVEFVDIVKKWCLDLSPFRDAVDDYASTFKKKVEYNVPSDESNFLFHYPDDDFMYTLLIAGIGINEKVAKEMLEDLQRLKRLYAHLVHQLS